MDPSHVPIPTNDGEQLLFSNFFETLVRIDCQGHVRPQLAAAWTRDSAGRSWTFTLRDARGAGGISDMAEVIASSWHDRWAAVADIGVDSVSIQPGGRLRVSMRTPLDSLPRIFADPTLAQTHQIDSAPWPTTGAGIIWRSRAGPGLVAFRVKRDVDARDALDAGADIMVTRDPELLDYAARRPEFSVFPLPWNRTYVLLWPAEADSAPRSLNDAVRAEARPAEPPFWWEDLAGCAERAVPSPRSRSARVVYSRGDNVARALAERIVAVANADVNLRTAALEPSEFAASLTQGLDQAYILALRRQTLSPCRDASRWPSGATVQPLIDTRAHAIVRRGAPPLAVDWDGTVRVVPR